MNHSITEVVKNFEIKELPQDVRNIVGRTVLKGVHLQATPRIEYESTLHY